MRAVCPIPSVNQARRRFSPLTPPHSRLTVLSEQPSNRFGRPLFQGLQYSDTPTVPLAKMEYTLKDTVTFNKRGFKVMTVNTAGLQSK